MWRVMIPLVAFSFVGNAAAENAPGGYSAALRNRMRSAISPFKSPPSTKVRHSGGAKPLLTGITDLPDGSVLQVYLKKPSVCLSNNCVTPTPPSGMTSERVIVRNGGFQAGNWLRVFPGHPICLKAAVKLDFQPLPPHRVASSFLECQNGWKPLWASDSHAVGCRAVRAICLAAPIHRPPRSGTEARFVQDLQLYSAAALSGLSVEGAADRQG